MIIGEQSKKEAHTRVIGNTKRVITCAFPAAHPQLCPFNAVKRNKYCQEKVYLKKKKKSNV